jgi:hypothetical protein
VPEAPMTDLLLVAVTVAFFAGTFGLVVLVDRL